LVPATINFRTAKNDIILSHIKKKQKKKKGMKRYRIIYVSR